MSCDPARMQQVIWNLLSNAIKFTPEGGTVHVVGGRDDGGMSFSAVTDTGVGIEPEFLPHVFDRFRQQDPATTRTHGGLGLGLSIVRHIVEHAWREHRGRQCGGGARSDVQREDAALAATAAARGSVERRICRGMPSLEGIRVLVVDNEARRARAGQGHPREPWSGSDRGGIRS